MSTFTTTSIDLACWLLTQGAPFPEVVFNGAHRRCSFVFDDPEGEWGWAAQSWLCDSGDDAPQCSAKRLFAAFRKLREAMNEARRRCV